MLHTIAWLITGRPDLKYACPDQGKAEAWIRRLSIDVDARLTDLVARWEAEQEAKEQFALGVALGRAEGMRACQQSAAGSQGSSDRTSSGPPVVEPSTGNLSAQ